MEGWAVMAPFYVGSVPRTDRLENGPYIGVEPRCYPVVRFRTTNWDTRSVYHRGLENLQ